MPSMEAHEIIKAIEICNNLGVDARLFQLSAKTYSKPSLSRFMPAKSTNPYPLPRM